MKKYKLEYYFVHVFMMVNWLMVMTLKLHFRKLHVHAVVFKTTAAKKEKAKRS